MLPFLLPYRTVNSVGRWGRGGVLKGLQMDSSVPISSGGAGELRSGSAKSKMQKIADPTPPCMSAMCPVGEGPHAAPWHYLWSCITCHSRHALHYVTLPYFMAIALRTSSLMASSAYQSGGVWSRVSCHRPYASPAFVYMSTGGRGTGKGPEMPNGKDKPAQCHDQGWRPRWQPWQPPFKKAALKGCGQRH